MTAQGQILKFIFLGESSVGKTSLIEKFANENFQNNPQSTLGIDFTAKTMNLDENRHVRLHIWDAAGSERFRPLILGFIQDTQVAIVVFDITNYNSFEPISKWVDKIRMERGSDVIIMLVGNKTDMAEKRQVSTEEGEKKAKELNVMYIETSAKNGHNVKQLFKQVAIEFLPTEISNSFILPPKVKDVNEDLSKKRYWFCCCC